TVGLLRVGAFDPLSAAGTERYNRLQQRYFDNVDPMMVSASVSGLWLRQTTGKTSYVLNARSMTQNEPKFSHVVLLSFDGQDHFLKRFNAATAELPDQPSLLPNLQILQPNN